MSDRRFEGLYKQLMGLFEATGSTTQGGEVIIRNAYDALLEGERLDLEDKLGRFSGFYSAFKGGKLKYIITDTKPVEHEEYIFKAFMTDNVSGYTLQLLPTLEYAKERMDLKYGPAKKAPRFLADDKEIGKARRDRLVDTWVDNEIHLHSPHSYIERKEKTIVVYAANTVIPQRFVEWLRGDGLPHHISSNRSPLVHDILLLLEKGSKRIADDEERKAADKKRRYTLRESRKLIGSEL
ncbi:MAG: hypothetical protein HY518_00245 [Candidatus Aenigmarchaeota archaeon]|nr:hypothetical protein [Candidatus Aenigmarchaeota archaeon]